MLTTQITRCLSFRFQQMAVHVGAHMGRITAWHLAAGNPQRRPIHGYVSLHIDIDNELLLAFHCALSLGPQRFLWISPHGCDLPLIH